MQEAWMKLFQLHYLNSSDAVVLNRALAAPHDLDAIREAERRSYTHTIEVWDGDRKVARVRKSSVASRQRPERTGSVGK
jgi:hypothetical protein